MTTAVLAVVLVTKMFDTSLNVSQRNDACFELRGNSEAPVKEAMLKALHIDSLRACASANLRIAGAVDELRAALADVAPEVRAAAARELGSFEKPELLPELAKAAGDASLLVATNAMQGLAYYQSRTVLPYLEKIAWRGGITGILALDQMLTLNDAKTLETARHLLQTGELPDRVSSLRVIGELGDASDLPPLRELASQTDINMAPQRGFGLMPNINLSQAAKNTIRQIESRSGATKGA